MDQRGGRNYVNGVRWRMVRLAVGIGGARGSLGEIFRSEVLLLFGRGLRVSWEHEKIRANGRQLKGEYELYKLKGTPRATVVGCVHEAWCSMRVKDGGCYLRLTLGGWTPTALPRSSRGVTN